MARAFRRPVASLDQMIAGDDRNAGMTTSYIEAIGDLTLEERKMMRIKVNRVLLDSALDSGIKTDPLDLVIREVLPNTDLGVGIGGPAVGAGVGEDWLCQIAGGAALAEIQYFSALLGVTTHVAFYGVSLETVPFSFSRIRLQQGATGVTTRFVGQMEKLFPRLETIGYFSDVVLFTKQETVRCMLTPRVASVALTQRIALLGRTIEPVDNMVNRAAV